MPICNGDARAVAGAYALVRSAASLPDSANRYPGMMVYREDLQAPAVWDGGRWAGIKTETLSTTGGAITNQPIFAVSITATPDYDSIAFVWSHIYLSKGSAASNFGSMLFTSVNDVQLNGRGPQMAYAAPGVQSSADGMQRLSGSFPRVAAVAFSANVWVFSRVGGGGHSAAVFADFRLNRGDMAIVPRW